MKVTTVGGGPGGLYAGLLLKQSHPDWEVRVLERNPADETYGWGIVFPDRALSKLEAADPETHERITEAFYLWDPIDTFVDERQYRCGGHTFASMMRADLLSILQERCREVGVDLEFEAEVGDPAARAAEADLLVGADGLGSATREAFSGAFGTRIVEGTDRFAWFGTDAEFEALTHTFDHNEDGVWRIHAYPGETTTFIVDCDAETWAESGMAEMSEPEYLGYLEEVFAGYLDGHGIRSKNDRWWTFRTVRNESWYHDNVVLLGDAVRTAHFSIGSGTRLAMGDALALAEALEGHGGGDDVGAALSAYEAERKPFAETILEAAELSRVHYEHCRRYLGLPDLQFKLHHLTRSGRITYDSLRRRDPAFVEEFREWFAGRTGAPVAETDGVAPPAFQPYALAGVTFPNRTVLAATGGATGAGGPDDAYRAALAGAAAREPGLVLTGPVAATDAGREGETPAIGTAAQAAAWSEAVDAARADNGVPLGLRLTHHTADVAHGDLPAFAGAAERAGDAGFDALELDFGTGALGAPLAGAGDRRTLPLEVVAAVRASWDGPLFARLPAAGDRHGIEDAYPAAGALAARGADLIVATGRPTVAPGVAGVPATVDPAADWLRNGAGVATMSTRGVTTRDAVDTLVGAGRADLVAFDAAASEDVGGAGSLAADLL